MDHEYDIARALYEGGISVPKPEGLCRVMIPSIAPFELNGFVMEHIEGSCDSFPSDHVANLRDQEIDKAKDLGFIPGRDFRSNQIYNPNEDRVYLIDFAGWKKK